MLRFTVVVKFSVSFIMSGFVFISMTVFISDTNCIALGRITNLKVFRFSKKDTNSHFKKR